MGNFICGSKRKKTSEASKESDEHNANTDDVDKGTEKKEEVLYATIDHGNGKRAGNAVAIAEGDECDYAIVKIPSEDKLSIKQDCSDDYVLMG